MLRLFRWVALFEGLTTLALFFVAMPLKYGFDNPVLIRPVGLIHGIAFLAYIAVMVVALRGQGFTTSGWVRTTLAAFVPLGTFLNDPFIRQHEARLATPGRPSPQTT